MPPKQARQQNKKFQRANSTEFNNMRNKKKLINAKENSYLDNVQYLQNFFEDQSTPTQRKKPSVKTNLQNLFQKESCLQEIHQQVECLACLQDKFVEGKYILDCRHVFCNLCFNYWSNLSVKCLACHKKSNSVMMILDGSTRVQAICPKYREQNCEICNKNYNEHQIYYCDSCNEGCVHTYCQPKLMVQKEDQFWVCKECQKQNRKFKGKSSKNFQYCEQLENFEDFTQRQSTFGRGKKYKSKNSQISREQRNDKNKKKKERNGK